MIKAAFIALIVMLYSIPASAEGGDVVCQILANHKPTVGVAYQPGVDVNGNEVVPADLNAAGSAPDVIRIPTTVNVAKHTSQDLPEGTEMNAEFGFVELYADGRVFYGENDMSQQTYDTCGLTYVNPNTPAPPLKPVIEPPEPKEEIIWGENY